MRTVLLAREEETQKSTATINQSLSSLIISESTTSTTTKTTNDVASSSNVNDNAQVMDFVRPSMSVQYSQSIVEQMSTATSTTPSSQSVFTRVSSTRSKNLDTVTIAPKKSETEISKPLFSGPSPDIIMQNLTPEHFLNKWNEYISRSNL